MEEEKLNYVFKTFLPAIEEEPIKALPIIVKTASAAKDHYIPVEEDD